MAVQAAGEGFFGEPVQGIIAGSLGRKMYQ
jgi:hypothetical protein